MSRLSLKENRLIFQEKKDLIEILKIYRKLYKTADF